MTKHIKIKITGKVQGVGFRYHTKKAADEIGVMGFVKNKHDGSVYRSIRRTRQNRPIYKLVPSRPQVGFGRKSRSKRLRGN